MPSRQGVRNRTHAASQVEERLGDRADGRGWFTSIAPLAIAAECYVGLILVPYFLPLIVSQL